MTYRPPYTTLANIRQEVGESLQDYFKCFNAEVTKVEKAPESSLVCMLITGVLPRTDFWKELQARRLESLVEIFAMAELHQRIENSLAELEKVKDKHESPVPRSRSCSPRRKSSRERSPRRRSLQRQQSLKLAKSPPKKESSPKRKSGPRFVNYTQLAVPQDHIYAIEEKNGIFKKPPPIRGNRDKRDPKKICKYHKDIGHITLECWFLLDEIEELIKRGKFNKYKKNEKSYPQADDKEENNNASGLR
uniref:Retrotransposon gag domain-containing protein n=1 Tax=Cannabis sativa TaxID=3483 RepID=A0A803QHQ8_CANSA